MIARDGRIVWFNDEARLVHHADGKPAYWQGVMIDITARREAEAQVAEAEARYRALVEQMPSDHLHGRARAGAAGSLYISPQTTSILGYTPQDWYADADLWTSSCIPTTPSGPSRRRSVGRIHDVTLPDDRARTAARSGSTIRRG